MGNQKCHYPRMSLIIILIILASIGQCFGLFCYHCTDSNGDYNCSTLGIGALRSCVNNGDFCFKMIMFNRGSDEKGQPIHTVQRGCKTRSNESISECHFRKRLSEPHDGIICLCNDHDYCNGGWNWRQPPLIFSIINHVQLVAVFGLIVNGVLSSLLISC